MISRRWRRGGEKSRRGGGAAVLYIRELLGLSIYLFICIPASSTSLCTCSPNWPYDCTTRSGQSSLRLSASPEPQYIQVLHRVHFCYNALKCLDYSSEIVFHIDTVASHSCCRFTYWISLICIGCFTTCQMCNTGLRAGECED